MKKLFLLLILFTAISNFSFSEQTDFNLETIKSGTYICTYEEQYYDGIGESVLKISQNDNGFYIIWEGITDTTEVHTDKDFNTLKMRLSDDDTDIEAVRVGNKLKVSGMDKDKKIDESLSIKSDKWFQLLPVSFISFTGSSENSIKFSMFDPYNIRVMNMTAEKKEEVEISTDSGDYQTVRLTMKMQGVLSLLWKSELWSSRETGLQIKYKGLNVIPKFYTAVISLKKIELLD